MRVRTRARVKGIQRTSRYFDGMARRSKDFRPLFRWAQRELEREWIKNFRSRGASSGKPWLPLDNEYARWKLENYGPLPTLIREGTLFKDLSFLSGPPNDIGMTVATFGTDAPSAQFHQSGTRNMPQRQVVFVPRLFAERLGRKALDYMVSGNITGISTNDARGLFRS